MSKGSTTGSAYARLARHAIDHPAIEGERWRWVSEAIEVSDLGRVRMTVRFPLSGKASLGRYASVKIRGDYFYVHRLVAEAFIGPCPAGKVVNHIDADKTNNRADNLEYVTYAQNVAHARRLGLGTKGSKLSLEKARIIRERRKNGELIGKLAEEYGVGNTTVWSLLTGKTWKERTEEG